VRSEPHKWFGNKQLVDGHKKDTQTNLYYLKNIENYSTPPIDKNVWETWKPGPDPKPAPPVRHADVTFPKSRKTTNSIMSLGWCCLDVLVKHWGQLGRQGQWWKSGGLQPSWVLTWLVDVFCHLLWLEAHLLYSSFNMLHKDELIQKHERKNELYFI